MLAPQNATRHLRTNTDAILETPCSWGRLLAYVVPQPELATRDPGERASPRIG